MATAPTSLLGRLLDVPEAARYLDMTEPQLRRHIAARRVRVLRAGRKVQLYTTWLDEFRERFTVEPTGTSRGEIPEERPTFGLSVVESQLRSVKRQIHVR